MKMILKAAALSLAPIMGLALASAPAAAQSKTGIAVVNLDRAAAESNAYKVAQQQMNTTYKPQIDSFNARKTALETDLKTKQDALQAGMKAAGGKPTPALQTQYEDLQKAGQAAQAELQRLGQPVALANAYVEAQLADKIDEALKSAMTKAKVDLVLKEAATESYQPYVDITSNVTAELNTVLPSVSIVPPAGWQPGKPLNGAAPANPAQQPQSR